jgi:hypothetical protein
MTVSTPAFGRTTTKTPEGFAWKVTSTVWDETAQKAVTTTLKSGVRATRAQALTPAKKWLVYFRRGGKIEA